LTIQCPLWFWRRPKFLDCHIAFVGQIHRQGLDRLTTTLLQAEEKKDSKKAKELFQKIGELGKKLGPEYVALMDGLQDIDPEGEVGAEITSAFRELDRKCTR